MRGHDTITRHIQRTEIQPIRQFGGDHVKHARRKHEFPCNQRRS